MHFTCMCFHQRKIINLIMVRFTSAWSPNLEIFPSAKVFILLKSHLPEEGDCDVVDSELGIP